MADVTDLSNTMNLDSPLIRPWSVSYGKYTGDKEFELPPRIIYRYLSANRAIEALISKKLWFSCPNNFNDPFDMYHGLIDFSLNLDRAKDFANRVRAGQNRSIRRGVTRDVLRRGKEFIAYQRKQFEETKSKSGVCCFSKQPDVTLMWSHYADSHQGVVLGFNIDPVRANPFDNNPTFFVQPVRYQREVKSKSIHDEKERAISHWILTKSTIWEYEQEVRAFCLLRNGLIEFDKNCLKEVYFGCKTSVENITKVVAQIDEQQFKNVSLKKADINPTTFDLKINQFDIK